MGEYMKTGIIRRVVGQKGYGFIGADKDDLDLFFHFSAVVGGIKKFQELRAGDFVTFLPHESRGKKYAINVNLEDHAYNKRVLGEVRTLIHDKKFGFIRTLDTREDLFFHADELINTKFSDLQFGQRVSFLAREQRRGKFAIDVRLEENEQEPLADQAV